MIRFKAYHWQIRKIAILHGYLSYLWLLTTNCSFYCRIHIHTQFIQTSNTSHCSLISFFSVFNHGILISQTNFSSPFLTTSVQTSCKHHFSKFPHHNNLRLQGIKGERLITSLFTKFNAPHKIISSKWVADWIQVGYTSSSQHSGWGMSLNGSFEYILQHSHTN